MSDILRCPFCQQEYIITKDDSCFGQQRCVCRNPNCEFDGWHFPVKFVSELIRTRNALDFAISTLTVISEGLVIEHSVVGHEDDNKIKLAKIALDKIKTAIEQKD